MKINIRWSFAAILIASVVLPLLVFKFYDMQIVSKTHAWTGKQNQRDVMQKHPVIASIYDSFYNHEEKAEYAIDDLEQYNVTIQNKITADIHEYEKEINILLDQRIIKRELLELRSNETYTIPFGTLNLGNKENGTSSLYQIFYINNANTKDAHFTRDQKTGKIISFTITSPFIENYSQEQKKTLLWDFIAYLKLDTVKDWNFNENFYESYSIRTQIYMNIIDNGTTKILIVGMCPIGMYSSNSQSHLVF